MQIHLKQLIHDRFEDVPDGAGVMIVAPDCKHNCKGCCNEHIKSMPTITRDSLDIMDEINNNYLISWVIFAGLDPLTYPDELCEMIRLSLEGGLNVIIYTGEPDREHILKRAPDLSKFSGRGVLVKYGEYDETKRVHDYYSKGILLATSNQYVEEL